MWIFGKKQAEKREQDIAQKAMWEKIRRESMGKFLFMKGNCWTKYPTLPPRFHEYCLTMNEYNDNEMDDLFFPIGADIIKSIAKPYYTAIHATSRYTWEERNDLKNTRNIACEMISRCHDFLSCYNLTSFTDEKKDNILSVCHDDFSIFNFLARENHHSYYYSAFCYAESPDISGFKTLDELFSKADYSIYFECAKCPDYLSIIIDTEKVDISDIITAIKEVLRGYGKTLLIDIGE